MLGFEKEAYLDTKRPYFLEGLYQEVIKKELQKGGFFGGQVFFRSLVVSKVTNLPKSRDNDSTDMQNSKLYGLGFSAESKVNNIKT